MLSFLEIFDFDALVALDLHAIQIEACTGIFEDHRIVFIYIWCFHLLKRAEKFEEFS